MSQPVTTREPSSPAPVHTVRVFSRFATHQRWEHLLLMLSFTVLLLTGLPQKYRTAEWSQQLLNTPERIQLVQTIHHYAAIFLILEAIYHIGVAVLQMSRRKLPADMFVHPKDFSDAWQMLAYLLFLRKDKPVFGKYNFEQKVTYWFIFVGVGLLIVSGVIMWFPEIATRLLPGSAIPAAKLMHSTEAVVAGIFIVLWHFYHVHIERLNLSIFTGKMNEEDMQEYHPIDYQRLTGEKPATRGGERK